MDRRTFLRGAAGAILGLQQLALRIQPQEAAGRRSVTPALDFKVLVIGAGAAGLAAGFALERRGVEFEILEASSRIGGRMKRISDFADFPIDLGAEWIHTAPSILEELAHDPEAGRKFEVVKYNPWISTWKGGRIRKNRLASLVYAEHKFKRTTWFGFFEKHLASRIQGRIRLDSPVRAIDVSGRRVQVITQDGTTHKADRIIVTVPLTVLKEAEIQFTPELPGEKVAALNRLSMPDGLKLFFEFRERFYPDLLQGGPNKIQGWGEKIYYDAAFKKDSSRNILGLFTVGDPARPYATAATDQETVDLALDELDRIFGGAASKHHVKHVVQNWSKEPFIRGSYTFDTDAATRAILRSPLEGKVFFAGETYAESWATVHGAALSGFEAVDQVLESTSRTF